MDLVIMGFRLWRVVSSIYEIKSPQAPQDSGELPAPGGCHTVYAAIHHPAWIVTGAGRLLRPGSGDVFSEAPYPVNGERQLGAIFGCVEPGILALQILVRDPTGLGAAPSDVDRDAVVNDLRQQLLKRRPADTVYLLDDVVLHQVGSLA